MAEFRMPALGADMEAGTLVAWRAKPGDTLQRGDVIAEVETDKGVIEVEVWSHGVLERYLVQPGQKVPVGTPLAVLTDGAEPRPPVQPATLTPTPVVSAAPVVSASPVAAAPSLVAAPPPQVAAALQVAAVADARTASAPLVAASPAVRRRARELGVDLRELVAPLQRVTMADVIAARPQVSAQTHVRSSPAARKRAQALGVALETLHGTGPEGAVVVADVERAASRPPPERTGMRRAMAAAMARSKRDIPHYYLTTTIDFSRAYAWLATYNAARSVKERMLPGVLLLKAVARACRAQPDLSCVWSGDSLLRASDINVGVAVSLRGGGLIAPAIHAADALDLPQLMIKLQDLVLRARAGGLRSSELSDGTITVTSLGERGVETVLPIIYPPQTAIVGFGRIADRPWVVDGALAVRTLVSASLAADHRVTDGHVGARFLNHIDELLQEPERL
jgi:pyruvate dehydrogenase E2 component (dihydrolipoamide acetyltransferase)